MILNFFICSNFLIGFTYVHFFELNFCIPTNIYILAALKFLQLIRVSNFIVNGLSSPIV